MGIVSIWLYQYWLGSAGKYMEQMSKWQLTLCTSLTFNESDTGKYIVRRFIDKKKLERAQRETIYFTLDSYTGRRDTLFTS